jgi:hypothetical protein
MSFTRRLLVRQLGHGEGIVSTSADRAFRRKFSMRGRATPRPNLGDGRARTDDMDWLNFGRATDAPPNAWRVEYCAEDLPRRFYVRDVYAYEGGRGMFLSRIERNRLVHSRNCNTAPASTRGRTAGRGRRGE